MSTLGELFTAFSNERTQHRDPDTRAIIDRLESAAEAAVCKENEIGGQARQVVGNVAVALGVVLGDTGPRMSVWDPANMRRVVGAAEALRKRLAELETSAEYWGANAPGGSLIDDLKNTIVSQAREIARLKGESA
ncbi:hypothetical protein CP967_31200 [Streptomyces nitrosporeus]|uniref:Uncharacterized protein n=1 Tax=Streptomyces nitrosporeus TaxID=28894 RepID=A0A5J6FGZ4_9ACTN|nr:hypothetical protein [Streptomyces nitrosporeus]QEU75839.1 hypothetical protein CP967_31200 [Streptomyces nitrosporeus]GGY88684.1 hypothetical protein GCM10010327_19260 [Streptomyces nitrosporeus]